MLSDDFCQGPRRTPKARRQHNDQHGTGPGDSRFWLRNGSLNVGRFHPHQPQHQVDLSAVMDFVLLYTIDKDLPRIRDDSRLLV